MFSFKGNIHYDSAPPKTETAWAGLEPSILCVRGTRRGQILNGAQLLLEHKHHTSPKAAQCQFHWKAGQCVNGGQD